MQDTDSGPVNDIPVRSGDSDLTLDLTQDQPGPAAPAPPRGPAAPAPPGGPAAPAPPGGPAASAPPGGPVAPAPPGGPAAPAPPGGPPLLLNVTDPQPRIQIRPYVQEKQRDYVRMVVTVGLLLMLGWVIVWASIESASWPDHWSQTKEMLQTILPAVTGLIGSVIGFYFGSSLSNNTTNTGTIGPGK